MAPKCSVIIPVFNGRKYIQDALESIAAQSMPDFECLVVDDGSTDGSCEIVQNLVSRDPRFHLIRNQHGGIVSALNTGIRIASSACIARMDADDIAHPSRFEWQLAFLEAHSEVVALGAAVLHVDPKNRPIEETAPPPGNDEILALIKSGKGSAMIHPTLMVRTEAVRKIGGYREDYRHIEDLDLYWRLAKYGKLANVSEVLLRYRQHPNSANMRHADEQRKRTSRWLEECVAAPGEKIELSFYRPAGLASLYADWSRKSLRAGFFATAWIYAWKAFLRDPLSISAWKQIAVVGMKTLKARL